MSDLDQFRPIDGHDDIYRRADQRPDWSTMLFREKRLATGTDLNDANELARRRAQSIGDMVARDGDRIEGADAVVDQDAGTVRLDAGELYVRGRKRSIGDATLTGVPMTGDVTIGVRISTSIVDEIEDDALLGLHPGSLAQGEPGAVVEVESIAWGWAKDAQTNDGASGNLVPVYRLRDGVIIDQTRPADLSVVAQRLELYDHDSNGNYIVRGCEVYSLGTVTLTDPATANDFDAQAFSIAAGTANILGAKRTRTADMRIHVAEDPQIGTVDLEPHSFADDGAGTATIQLRRTPVQTVSAAIVTKLITETVIRGSGDADTLGQDGVQQIVTVEQGATTYTATTDYQRVGDQVDWSPGGAQPASGESYDVTYLYLEGVSIDAATPTSVTISGGVTDEPVFVAYSYKLPRIDRICLDREGVPAYLKGVAAAEDPLPPAVPDTLLSLATVTNSWDGPPEVRSDGTRRITEAQQHRYNEAVLGLLDLVGVERLRRDLDSREPVAKQGVFVDPFNDDRYRDSGEPQTAAVFGGAMRLPIDATITAIDLIGPVHLDYTDEVLIEQTLASGCMKINPYMTFAPPPARMSLSPAVDFWEETNTIWDDETRVFGAGDLSSTSTSTLDLGSTTAQARFLRQIPITVSIDGFGGGENLEALSFDGIDVTPADETAELDGTLSVTFTIPAGVTVGTKPVVARGEGGSVGLAEFVGGGTIETTRMRRITTITRWTEPAPVLASPPPPTIPGSANPHHPNFIGNRRSGESEPNHWDSDTQRQETSPPGYRGTMDPLAQTFMLLESRMISGIDVQVCAIGDRANPVICELVSVENGIPTGNAIAQTEVDMQTVVVGQWTGFTFAVPIFVAAGVEYAFVFKTDDAEHSLRIATRGDFDNNEQQYVGGQPYIVGVLLSSSNARTWTPHQNSDLTMHVRAALFNPTQLEVVLGTVAVTQMSDLVLQAAIDLPTAEAAVVFDVHFDDTSVRSVEPNRPLRLDAFYTGNITIHARLFGSPFISPILLPRVLAIAGTLQPSGTYVSRAFDLGETIRLITRLKTQLPTGSTVDVEFDRADDSWSDLPQTEASTIENGWQERVFEGTGITGTKGRLRLTLTGNPAARPLVSDLRTASI